MNSSKHDCADIRQYLHLLLGGELESDPQLQQQLQATEEHLSECGACRKELEHAKLSRELYLTAAVDSDSEELDLWPGIRSRLYSEQILKPQVSHYAESHYAEAGDSRASSPDSLMPARAAGRTQFTLLRRLAPVSTVIAAAAALLIGLPLLKTAFVNENPTAPADETVRELNLPSNAGQVASSTAVTPITGMSVKFGGSAIVADVPNYVADAAPMTAPMTASMTTNPTGLGLGLRPVLSGDESLLEREQRQLLEQGYYKEQRLPFGSGPGAFTTHSFEPSLYDVVNQRQLR